MNKDSVLKFLTSSIGRWVLTLFFALIIWGTLFGVANSGSDAGIMIFFGVCGIFGWKALNKVQPSMFLWLSWAGWLIYFAIKFILSVLIGVVVAPYQIGKFIAEKISEIAAEI